MRAGRRVLKWRRPYFAERCLIKRYVAQLSEQEDRLSALRGETTELTRKLEQARADLDALIERLSLDVLVADAAANP